MKNLSLYDFLNYCPVCRFCDQEMEATLFSSPFRPQNFPNLTDKTVSFKFMNENHAYTLNINCINNIYSLFNDYGPVNLNKITDIFLQFFIVVSCMSCCKYNYSSNILTFKDNKIINLDIDVESFSVYDWDITFMYSENITNINKWRTVSLSTVAQDITTVLLPIDSFDFKNQDKMLKKINNILMLG